MSAGATADIIPTPTAGAPVPTSDSSEAILALPDGRQVAYASNGYPQSRTVALFFSGLFAVGSADEVLPAVEREKMHYIAPTPPGFGNSSPAAKDVSYAVSLARDMTRLIDALHPDGIDALYIGGGSYGTVLAQILYGAPYDVFPPGRAIVGCLLLAGFSPFKYHTGYTKCLTWPNYMMIGPPAQLPFRAMQRLMRVALSSKMKTREGAAGFINDSIFSKMDDEERGLMADFLERRGKTQEQMLNNMSDGAVRSVSRTWEGTMEVSDVLHSDWGFNPDTLDDEHNKPVLVVGAERDDIGGAMNEWLVEHYKAARLKIIKGGHIGALFCIDELWDEFVETAKGKK